MANKPYHHGDLRTELVALATTEIAQNGLEGLSVRALARDAGVAHRAAYQHFPDKSALIAAVLRGGFLRLTACLTGGEEVISPKNRLRRIAKAYSTFAFDEPNLFLAMTGPRINQSGTYPDLEKAIFLSWQPVTDAVRDGVEAGDFTLKDKHAVAAIFWGGLQGVLTQALLKRLKIKPTDREKFFQTVAERLIAGL